MTEEVWEREAPSTASGESKAASSLLNLAASSLLGLARFEVTECPYSLVAREIETGLLPVAAQQRVGVIAYSPLAAGFLTGKYSPDRTAVPKGTRFDVIPGHADVYFQDRNFRYVEYLRQLSDRTGLPAERLAMAWALQNPHVDTVLVGARTNAHLDNAVAAAATEFPAAWMEEVRQWE